MGKPSRQRGSKVGEGERGREMKSRKRIGSRCLMGPKKSVRGEGMPVVRCLELTLTESTPDVIP